MSNSYSYVKLKVLCDVNQGLQIPIESRFTENAPNRYFYITVQFLKASYTNKFYVENPPSSSICCEEDILIVRTGSTGQIVTGVKGCFHNNFFKVNFNKELIHGRYLYHCLNTKEKYRDMLRRAGVTTIPDLNHFMFLDMEIPVPKKQNQIEIAKTLDTLDSKIELNNRINAELEAMAKTLYDYWFVQFDIPDKNGKPYKSSGGTLVWNEELKREIPEGWEVKDLGEIINIFDSKRIPLSRGEREKKVGNIPYYGATSVMGYVDEYIFDDDYVLIAEDGSVMDEKGFPIVQFIWGKTWVNNHAHVIQAKNVINNEYIFYLVKTISVIQIMSGSIQLKINQENLKRVKVCVPDENTLKKFASFAIPVRKQLINAIEENQKLTELRDWLLPMLMNGQVKVN